MFYLAGIAVRSRYGVRVVIQNDSGATLRNASVRLEKGPAYSLGEIESRTSRHVFVRTRAESSVLLDFDDATGVHHTNVVAGYIENDYCGEVAVNVLQGFSVNSRDKSFTLFNWKSWPGLR